MAQDIVEAFVYSAALDVYRRCNRREIRLETKETMAMLDLVDWEKRPRLCR